MKKPVVINIKSLIGTMIIIGDSKTIPNQVGDKVAKELLKVLATVQNLESPEPTGDKSSKQSEDSQN